MRQPDAPAVAEAIYDEVVEGVKSTLAGLVTGDPSIRQRDSGR